jgi:hypothetical protein
MAKHNAEKYTYRVRWSEEDQEHVGLVAEFPSLSWLAPDIGAALNGITRLVSEVLADMAKSKETPPNRCRCRSSRARSPFGFHPNSIASSPWRPPSKACR